MDGFAVLPNTDDGYTFLSRTNTGKLYKKHILSKGTLLHPTTGAKVDIDDAFLSALKTNFDNKVCDIVQVPLAGSNNEHTESPESNAGEVVDLQIEDGKAYAYIDARKHQDDFGKTLLGASAMLSMNYTDTRDGEAKGPTLLHVAVTNRPYVLGLEDYKEVLAASNEGQDAVFLTAAEPEKEVVVDTAPVVTPTTKDIPPMATKEELIAQLKDEYSVDVNALEATAAEATTVASLSATITEKLGELGSTIKLSNSTEAGTAASVIETVTAVVADNVQLSNKVDALILSNNKQTAETKVDDLVAKGFITPAKRDSQVELFLSNSALFEALLPEAPLVALSAEKGKDVVDEEQQAKVIADEIARLSAAGSAI